MVCLKNKIRMRSSRAAGPHLWWIVQLQVSRECTPQQSLQRPGRHSHPDLGDPSSLSTGPGMALSGQSCSCSSVSVCNHLRP